MKASIIALAAGIMMAMTTPNAKAAEIRVIAGGGASNVLQQLGPQFEQATGHKLNISYGGTPALVKQLASGEAFDLVVVPMQVLADASAKARLVAAPTKDIARVGVGLGVPEAAPKPDISTPDALKAALLKAKSITMVPESANGAHILKVFERLGIADAMKPKIVAQSDPLKLAPALARGEAEIGLYVTNQLLAPGIVLVGSFPDELNTYLTFTAGVSREAAQPEAAKAFIAHLTTPAAAAIIRAKGMEPVF
jgi:molybdate transport system substrate-binding protein